MSSEEVFRECAHCAGTGTCRNGANGVSCCVCIKKNKIKKGSEPMGLVCSVCKGEGQVQPFANRAKTLAGPIIALYVMATAIVTIIFGQEKHFPETLAFLSTLTGSIVAYYFATKKN